MSADLETFTNDELIAELINRQTFGGVVVWYTSNVKQGRLEHGELKIAKSPPLSKQNLESLLQQGLQLVPGMFPD
jgi:hypothetical protein